MNNNDKSGNNNFRNSVMVRTVVAFAICVCAILLISQIQPIKAVASWVVDMLFPVLLGVVLAYIVSPFTNFAERIIYKFAKFKKEKRRTRFARGMAIVFSVIALVSVILLLIFLIIPEFLESLGKLIDSAPEYFNELVEWFNNFQSSENAFIKNISQYLYSGLDAMVGWLSGELGTAVSGLIESLISVVSFFFDFLVSLVVFVYALLEKHRFVAQSKKVIIALFKPKMANDILHVARYSNEVFGKFITGKLITSTIVGVVTFTFMTIMGMPYALLSAGIIAITNVIPFFGPFIGGIPTALIVLLSDFRHGLIYVIFLIVLQQLEGNIIEPMIMEDRTGLSKFWIVFALLLCGGMFGIAGMIFAVPLFAVLFYTLKIAVERSLQRKNLPLTAFEYVNAGGVNEETGELVPAPPRKGRKTLDEAAKEWRERVKGEEDSTEESNNEE